MRDGSNLIHSLVSFNYYTYKNNNKIKNGANALSKMGFNNLSRFCQKPTYFVWFGFFKFHQYAVQMPTKECMERLNQLNDVPIGYFMLVLLMLTSKV